MVLRRTAVVAVLIPVLITAIHAGYVQKAGRLSGGPFFGIFSRGALTSKSVGLALLGWAVTGVVLGAGMSSLIQIVRSGSERAQSSPAEGINQQSTES